MEQTPVFKTECQAEREKRDLAIYEEWNKLVSVEGQSRTLVTEFLMKKYNIPTAAYENFDDPEKALAYLRTEAKFPIVLKADGLALGKGVLICKDLEEAAVVDGANILQQIWYVQLPAIKNIIVIQFILQAGNIMSIGFEKAYALQTDMNLPASEILSTYVYRIGLLNGDYGYSTAVGLFNSVINVILLIFVNWVVKKLNDGEGL